MNKSLFLNTSKKKSATLVGALFGAILCICALAMSGCSSNESSTTSTATSDSKDITFVLDYTPNTNHIGIYVAQELGYFKDAGFNVEIQQPPESGADALVGAGKAQFGVSYQDWMANYLGSSDPLPVTAVAAIIQHNTSSILSLTSSGITGPKEMTGTRYATMDVETEQRILESLCNNAGGDWSQVQVISNNSADEYQCLMSGQFDSVWAYDGWGVLMCELQGADVTAWDIASIDDTFDYYTPVIIANNEYLEQNPDDAKAFLAAVRKGYEYAIEHPDEAAQIMCEADPTLDEELVVASALNLADQYQADAEQWGTFDEARWAKFYTWMNEQGLTDVALDPTAGFTNDYIK